jgi:hypothetical protein
MMKNNGKLSTLSILPVLFFMSIVAAPNLLSGQENNPSNPGSHPKLGITFDYRRQSGIASNQFAVWIEDVAGQYIKTLYATRFAATGGWKKRPACLPEWVAAAQPDTLSSHEVDGITGATPSGGRLHYVWDGRDQNGNRLPAGAYRYVVEGNLRWDNRVVYSGKIELGGPLQTSQPQPEYSGDAEEERDMITNVVATYTP